MGRDNDSLVKVNNVSRYYGSVCAVDNLSFQIKPSEVIGLLGPNGAGKSTTLQMLSGNLAPTSGEIVVNHVDLFDQPKQAKQELGYLPHKPPLYPEFTVLEYLRFCARLNRINKGRQNQAIASAVERCGLESVQSKLIHNLSMGYQQRLGIAQAIIHSPKVIILDEPTVGLDPIQIREIRQLIRDLRKDHSIILSTHILPEVLTTCDKVLLINQGKLIVEETTSQLQQRMDKSTLLVAMRNPPDTKQLLTIAHVDQVEPIDGTHFRIHYQGQQDPSEYIVQAAVENHWRLYEITPDKISLEQVFVNLTTREPELPAKEPTLQ